MNTRSIQGRTDQAIVNDPEAVALLRAVAAGRIVTGPPSGATGQQADYLLDGVSVRRPVMWLREWDGLLTIRGTAPPMLAPRAERILAIANGEIATPPDA